MTWEKQCKFKTIARCQGCYPTIDVIDLKNMTRGSVSLCSQTQVSGPKNSASAREARLFCNSNVSTSQSVKLSRTRKVVTCLPGCVLSPGLDA